MKTAGRIIVSVFAAAAISIGLWWGYLIYYGRHGGLTEQNVNSFMWSVIAAGLLTTTGLTWLFCRWLRPSAHP